ncbi:FecR-like transmembrane sensor [Sphingobium terrigena]|jgi:transmembrane sensor|uniref:FecR-like transmembrane sensor n=1 Tax=Sphingobium terrigena TaxID=2304063 RepID=A0A418YPA9_9SPHN|nr:FecR domain-containing protein [Sphingobium terrigena]RJG53170.1 FecR-like transmembrane sensor [Sphingobium terrigena]
MSDHPTRIERQAYKWVMKMLDDPVRHAAALERWLSKDDEYRAVYKRVAIEVGRASDAAAQAPVLRAITRPARESVGWVPKGRMIAVGGMVAIGIAAAGVFGVLHMSLGNGGIGVSGKAPILAYAAGETDRSFTLSDASVVTLFAHGRIEADFSKSERSVRLLGGKARFAVAHNVTRPFVVYAAGGKVKATGTLFEVAIDGEVKVRLISGAIEVTYPRSSANRPEKVVRLGPGEQASYPPSAAVAPAPTPERSATSSARSLENFDDVPAAEIAERVNRSSSVKIVFADQAIGRREVFADLDVSDAEAVAQKLAKVLGLLIDRGQPGRLLLKSPN